MKRCKTCKGTYEPLQKGVRYFHVCSLEYDSVTKTYTKRQNARNENVNDADGRKGQIVEEGKGVEDV